MTMEATLDWVKGHILQTTLATSLVAASWVYFRRRKQNNVTVPTILEPERIYEKDVLYLHIFPRNLVRKSINISPFAIKVESWLRLKNIAYETVETMRWSKNGQIPFLVLNDVEYTESGRILKVISDKTCVSIDADLTSQQTATSRVATRMMDEAFVMSYFLFEFTYHNDLFRESCRLRKMWWTEEAVKGIGIKVGMRGDLMGLAKYGEEFVVQLGKDDIRALSVLLADKPYMLGDTPSLLDCTIFGHLSQIVYSELPYPFKHTLITECSNLVELCNKLKEQLWPDWEQLANTPDSE